jgi:hypothetical protein
MYPLIEGILIPDSKYELEDYNVYLNHNVSFMINKWIIYSGTLQDNLHLINPG